MVKYKKTKPNAHGKKKRFVKGYGGMVGRGVGWFAKQATTKGSTANWMLKKVKQLADAVNIEYKFQDYAAAGTTIDNVGFLNVPILPPQGVAESQRVGDSLKIQHFNMRFVLTRVTNDAVVRLIVYWDPQSKTSTGADILQNTGTSAAPIQPKNYDKRFQTRFLHDQTYVLNSNASTINAEVSIEVNEHMQFAAGTTTTTAGALKYLFISSNTGVTSPTVTYYSRCTYTDD